MRLFVLVALLSACGIPPARDPVFLPNGDGGTEQMPSSSSSRDASIDTTPTEMADAQPGRDAWIGSDAGVVADASPQPEAGFENVWSILTHNCLICHDGSSQIPLGMPNASAAYAALVGQASRSAFCSGEMFVVPGEPASSLLYTKLDPDGPPCGTRMPRGITDPPPLPDEDREVIYRWILEGARR